MREITLAAIPNQTLTVQLDETLYTLTFKETRGVMSVTISRNNEVIISGLRVIANAPLIPFSYLEEGNFALLTANEELPYYTQFGITQFLYYVSQAELEVIRGT